MKDGALVTCRVLWSLLGVVIDSKREVTPAAPTSAPRFASFQNLPASVVVSGFSKPEFDALPTAQDIILVLVAANKCVAHLDEYPDHGVSAEVLDREGLFHWPICVSIVPA